MSELTDAASPMTLVLRLQRRLNQWLPGLLHIRFYTVAVVSPEVWDQSLGPRSGPLGEVLRRVAERWTIAQRQGIMGFLKLTGRSVLVDVAVLTRVPPAKASFFEGWDIPLGSVAFILSHLLPSPAQCGLGSG